MANPPLFQRIRLVYRRSPLLLKVLVLVTILASAAALLALRGLMLGYQQPRPAHHTQALQKQGTAAIYQSVPMEVTLLCHGCASGSSSASTDVDYTLL